MSTRELTPQGLPVTPVELTQQELVDLVDAIDVSFDFMVPTQEAEARLRLGPIREKLVNARWYLFLKTLPATDQERKQP